MFDDNDKMRLKEWTEIEDRDREIFENYLRLKGMKMVNETIYKLNPTKNNKEIRDKLVYGEYGVVADKYYGMVGRVKTRLEELVSFYKKQLTVSQSIKKEPFYRQRIAEIEKNIKAINYDWTSDTVENIVKGVIYESPKERE